MEINGADNTDNLLIALPRLPWEIVCDIVSRFPIEAIVRFTSLSKACYSLKKDAAFIKLQLTRAKRRIIIEKRTANPMEEPLHGLYLLDEGEGGDSWKGREIPIRSGDECYLGTAASCNGLLCVHSENTEAVPLFIYNPLTRESVTLPLSNPKAEFCIITTGFGFDSETGKYKVVKLFKIDRKSGDSGGLPFRIEGEIITVGEKSWRRLGVPYIVLFGMRSSPVFSGGALHWIIDKTVHPSGLEKLLALDISTERFRSIDFSMTVRFPDNLHLVNYGDSLALIERGDWDKLRVCKILGTKGCYKTHKSSYEIPVVRTPVIWNLSFRGFWSNDNFVFQCMPKNSSEETNKNDHLALCCPKKKEFRIVEIFGVPNLFRAIFFVPTFVSLSA
ncbi:hypothetical protein GIB67_039435 [Kingdonia uniflora]|uniref:F-box domain-containing protein n=1 Tax=Kingdonia uniflora TaxID=39325 RepID=A0A7J7LIG8_9MAGN|nr:hypothetical protein GIB67_039435 [Kingdonia uniflora]